MSMQSKGIIAVLTNHDDDIYCFRKELIEALVAQGYEVLVSCPYGKKLDLLGHIPYIYDDPVIDRRGTNIVADFKLLRHYKKLFKRYRPKVVLTYTAKPNVYASIAARQLKIPYINNVTGVGSVLNKKGPLRALIMKLFQTAFRRADCIMFQNATNMQLAIDGGMVKGAYRLIPGSGVDPDRYPLQEYPAGGNGQEGEPIVFNYIGRILRDKGVDDYIAAAKHIKGKYPNVEFNMLGFIEPTESHYEVELAELGEQNIVLYRGNQKDVKPFIARAHATIHPSIYGEGMSNALLESAASGRPLITTDNPGCKETVNDGETGFVYRGGSVEELIDRIEIFLSMPNEQRKQMGERGREKVSKEFSRSIVVDAYLEEIGKILMDRGIS